MLKEYIKIAIKNLYTRSLRSWLTILGVVIGVFLVVALLALSEGIKKAVLVQLKTMGEDVLMVLPGEGGDIFTAMMGGLMLTDKDIKAMERADGVELVVPMLWRAETARHDGEAKTVSLMGYPREKAQDFLRTDMGFALVEGEWPRHGRREVMVGNIVPKDIFPGAEIGDDILIDGKRFKITGVLRTMGNKQDDSLIGLDMPFFQQVTGISRGAQFASIKIEKGYNPEEVSANITKKMEDTRKRARGSEDLPAFTIFTTENAIDVAGDILFLLQVMIFGVASIAVVVGGIGIMNTMYTSVRERTKEIGIIQAVGAKNSDITKIFLIESGLIGLIGGTGGVVLGMALAEAVEFYLQIHPVFQMEAVISPTLVISSLVASCVLGCLAGFLPTRQATKLNPVDALRYE